jgi:ATP-dependent Clp protease ATP-binding subunit ClpX
VPSIRNVVKVVIDGAVIKGESEPLMIYENSEQAKAVPDD